MNSDGQIERTHSTIIEIYNTNKNKFQNQETKSIIRASVALYNESIHSVTKFKPNEVIFNQNMSTEERENIQLNVNENLQSNFQRQLKLNGEREKTPHIEEGQEVFLKPNIRTKTQPRGNNVIAQQICHKIFYNEKGIKRNLNKIKRVKKN